MLKITYLAKNTYLAHHGRTETLGTACSCNTGSWQKHKCDYVNSSL